MLKFVFSTENNSQNLDMDFFLNQFFFSLLNNNFQDINSQTLN